MLDVGINFFYLLVNTDLDQKFFTKNKKLITENLICRSLVQKFFEKDTQEKT